MSWGTHELGFAACVECSTADEWMTTVDWQADGWVSRREGTAGMRFARSGGMAGTWAETRTGNNHYCSTSDWGITSRMKRTVRTVKSYDFSVTLILFEPSSNLISINKWSIKNTVSLHKWTHNRFLSQSFMENVL